MFFGRSAWNLVYGYAAAQGLSFASTFRLGTSFGLSSYRRAIMLGDYNIFKGVIPSMSYIKSIPNTQPIEAIMLAPGYPDQRRLYRYTVNLKGPSVFTGLPMNQPITLWSDVAKSKQELEKEALEQFGGLTKVEQYGIDVEEVTVSHGYARPS